MTKGEKRARAIAQNGNDGLHYENVHDSNQLKLDLEFDTKPLAIYSMAQYKLNPMSIKSIDDVRKILVGMGLILRINGDNLSQEQKELIQKGYFIKDEG